MTRDVVVTGVGAVTGLGSDAAESWRALRDGAVGVGPIEGFDPAATGLRSRVAAAAPAGAIDHRWADDLRERRGGRVGRFARLGLAAADEALDRAGLDPAADDWSPERVGVSLGSGLGGHPAARDGVHDAVGDASGPREDGRPDTGFALRTLSNMGAGHLGVALDARGPQHSPATACAAGSAAIATAVRDVADGRADVMVAGGAEAPVTPTGIGQFEAMRAVSTADQAGACRPFDADRRGFVLGEGAGVLVLEASGHARNRGAAPVARVGGSGSSGDGHHPARPPADGCGLRLAVERALEDAHRPAGAVADGPVDWICAHATGTPRGDAAEAAALRSAFDGDPPPVASAKGALGHTLGAAGAIEAVLAVQSIASGVVPPTTTCREPASDLGVDVVRSARELAPESVLSTAAGFGAVNSALVFERPASGGGRTGARPREAAGIDVAPGGARSS